MLNAHIGNGYMSVILEGHPKSGHVMLCKELVCDLASMDARCKIDRKRILVKWMVPSTYLVATTRLPR